ncbi:MULTISPECIES: type III secretion system chaperone family protein [Stenotrophomonas]|uniref:Sensory transduction regulator n=1 Tax=Stenotrophomonas rhizophila TaxID=216778 RepID=A0A498CPN1_9GAMM|nr:MULTISPECIES: YbjN domain-containing protein [Stenotrophomonas]KAB7633193.1 hypothetical protein F9K92_01395 [Stenotrophomonas rhizophila]MBU2047975.1 hypothetical protein [Gammaproteobacteria bacterium]RLK55855.1 hypothetical protein BCL79_0225 [Stenotrophomonas rhizophila]
MKRIAAALLLAVTATGAHAAEPDKAVGRALDTLKYTYEVDEDGDYKMVFDMDDGRSQLAFVRSTVEEFGKHKIREIWSPAYNSPGKQFPAAVANRLLEDSQDAKMGAWVKQDQLAMFVVKVDATATPEQLSDAIDAAVRTADAMELELTEQDEY